MLLLIVIGFVAGGITGVSPCMLPMLPMVFIGGIAGAPKSDSGDAGGVDPGPIRTGLNIRGWQRRPILIIAGLVVSFSLFTLTGSALLSALDLPQDFLRWAGLTILVVVGLAMVIPRLELLLQRPFQRLPKFGGRSGGNAFVLGLGLGTLYVPCAGPVLAAISIAGITGHFSGSVVALTLAFAVGAAIPLFFVARAGQRLSRLASLSRSRARRLRMAGGTVMVLLAVALAFSITDGLQRSVPCYTQALQNQVENNSLARGALAELNGPAKQKAVAPSRQGTASSSARSSSPSTTDRERPPAVAMATGPVVTCRSQSEVLANCGPTAEISGVASWLNTSSGYPTTIAALRGKVVLVDFWTYSCINCQRSLPFIEAWYTRYQVSGLEVIGIHTPEFAFEHVAGNVATAIADQKVNFPVALDNSSTTWQNFHNAYWPAEYLIDARGVLRHIADGEGGYATSEALIRQLLSAAHPGILLPTPIDPAAALK